MIMLVACALGANATPNMVCTESCIPVNCETYIRDVQETGTISIQDDILAVYSGFPAMQVIAVDVYSLPGLTLVKDFSGCGSSSCNYNLASASVAHGNYRIVVTKANYSQFYQDKEYN